MCIFRVLLVCLALTRTEKDEQEILPHLESVVLDGLASQGKQPKQSIWANPRPPRPPLDKTVAPFALRHLMRCYVTPRHVVDGTVMWVGFVRATFQVFRVFFKRVLLVLKGMVAGGDAAEICGRNGMQSFVEELRPTGTRLQRLFAHNVKASRFCRRAGDSIDLSILFPLVT